MATVKLAFLVFVVMYCVTNSFAEVTTTTQSTTGRASTQAITQTNTSTSSSSTTKQTTVVTPRTSMTTSSISSSTDSTTTLTPEEECKQQSGSCDGCVAKSQCLYCNTNSTCMLYPTGKIIPPSDMCSLSEARWGVCWVNFEALIIAVSVIGGIIILTITVCCIRCCCCRGNKKRKHDREDAKYDDQKMERKVKQDERRNERKGRLDEIRRKYGLMSDS